MPLQDHHRLFSVDDHLIEPPGLWEARLPKKYHDRAPQIVEMEAQGQQADGDTDLAKTLFKDKLEGKVQAWQYEGRIYPYIGLNAVAGRDPSEFGFNPIRFDQMIPGCYDPKERLADMDLDGVHAAAAFPSFPRFAGTVFYEADDKELAKLCVQAYNDFILDEWKGTDPERLLALCILPFWDVEASIAEVQRTAAHGANGYTFPENPAKLGLPSFHSDHWERLFSTLEEVSLPICLHFGSSGQVPVTAEDAPQAVFITLMGSNSMMAAVDLMFSPVFHRHPNLKVSLAEGGIGWIPWILERADDTWRRHRFYQNVNQEKLPSEVFATNIWGCFITDETGLEQRHKIGLDRITWECDYPHSDSNWPNSREVAKQMFADIPDHEVQAIVEDNAKVLFNIDQ